MLTVAQAAERLNARPGLVRRLLAAGLLRHCRIGLGRGVIRIPEDALEEYIRAVTVDASSSDGKATPAPRRRVSLRHLRL
ncbi:MAG: hypothetical protein KatS3mg108_2623 [Isosphaeraceae bacterium]|jgi:excisionase family DNA binding protein|nr:MAG: hypothetical protein KatS3mg108_2623 [Isosphaeraceae bacterium]